LALQISLWVSRKKKAGSNNFRKKGTNAHHPLRAHQFKKSERKKNIDFIF
jgi:hypothetical protein